MTDEAWQEVKHSFDVALELQDTERERYLDELTERDPAKAAEVRSLLTAYTADPEFLEEGPEVGEIVGAPSLGTRVGPFRLERQLGEGGMGVVFLARRVDGEFDQTAAVKFVKSGLSADSLQARFAAEREILARLKHPHIAHLYDGGVNQGGWPYLIMEYVDGQSITEYCVTVEASIRERVELLKTVCETVQFAHTNLVIHRDLKPSNILVTATGEVKLLDFGVAKLLAPIGGTAEPNPATVAPALTPSYSAPEQLRGDTVTTAADVYALGTIAYELFSGRRPFDFEGRNLAEIQRIVNEEEPRRPSATRVSSDRDGRVDPDLDTIVLMALRKEPHRRYASPAAMADDFQRFLDGLPIAARGPHFGYRATKFVRRKKGLVAAAAFALVASVAAALGTSWQARVATANALEAAAERDRAQMAAARTSRVSEFLLTILATANPSWYVDSDVKGPDVTVLEALVEAARRMETDLADDLEIQSDIHHTLGDTYRALGQYDNMLPHFEESLEIRERLFAPPHPKIAEGLFYMAAGASLVGDIARSDSLIQAAISMQQARNEGNNLPYMLSHLSTVREFQGRFAEAIQLQDEAIEAALASDGLDHPSVQDFKAARARQLLGAGEFDAGRLEAEAVLNNGPSGLAQITLARALQEEGALAEAEQLFRDAGQAAASSHPPFAFEESILIPSGRLQEAQQRLESALALNQPGQQWLGPAGDIRARVLLARTAMARGRTAEAESHLGVAATVLSQHEDEGQASYLWDERRMLKSTQALLLTERGQWQGAVDALRANLDELGDGRGSRADRDETLTEMAAVFDAWGRRDEAQRYRDMIGSQRVDTTP